VGLRNYFSAPLIGPAFAEPANLALAYALISHDREISANSGVSHCIAILHMDFRLVPIVAAKLTAM
jgi:hypothetical protein